MQTTALEEKPISISNRGLILTGGVVFAVFIVLLAFTLAYFEHTQAENEWKKNIKNLSLSISAHANQSFFSSTVLLQSITDEINGNRFADEAGFKASMAERSFHENLQKKINSNPLIDVAIVTDKNGEVINFSRFYPPIKINLDGKLQYDWWKSHNDDSVFYGEPVFNNFGKWSFYMSQRINDTSGRFLGVVLIGMSIDNFSKFYKTIFSNIGRSASIILYRRNGLIVAAWPESEALTGRFKASETDNDASIRGFSDSSVFITSPDESIRSSATKRRMIALSKVSDYPFYIEVSFGSDIYLDAYYRLLTPIFAIAFFANCLLFFTIKVFLKKDAQITNNYYHRALIQYELLQTKEQIEKQNKDLEIKVTKRTSEIAVKHEQLLWSHQQLELANRSKSEFLANMSHELRTPLNAIIGFSELLQQKVFGSLNEKQAEYIGDIHLSGKHLLTLINDILDLAKIESGQLELVVTDFELDDFIANTMVMVQDRAEKEQVELTVNIQTEILCHADKTKLRQVLINLLANAIKYTPAGGRVTVEVTATDLWMEFAVIDTGIGMSEAELEEVFEQFKQIDNFHNRINQGTGLGLSISRRLVELHGGQLKVESEVGYGSRFYFSIPVFEPQI